MAPEMTMKLLVAVLMAALMAACATVAPPEPRIASPPPAPPPVMKDWRSIDHVVRIDVAMPVADWDVLRRQDRQHDVGARSSVPVSNWSCEPFDSPFEWFEARVSIDGKEYKRARIRKKGFYGSLSTTKPALKLRLDKYIEQDHGGATRLTLNNSIQDESMVNTCLTYEVYRRAGIPTPLCNFARVTVNGADLGVYVNVEDMKTDYFKRAWHGAGNLYEGTFSDFLPELTGTFEKKTTKEPGLGYIEKVTDAIAEGDRAALEKLIDVDRFLTFWALESLTNTHDNYTYGINNYYFHESAAGLVFIPWGPDQAFRLPKGPVMGMRGALARALFPAHVEAYKATMRRLLATVWNERHLIEYVIRLAHAGWNDDTMRVIRFIASRREWIEGRLENADFHRYFRASEPYEGDCDAAGDRPARGVRLS